MSGLEDVMFARPFVYATAADLQKLRRIAMDDGAAPGGWLLAEEIERMAAAPQRPPRRFVRLGAHVTYLDLRSKRRRRVRVMAPEAVVPDENHVSVTSPIGAALIGLPEFALFRWRTDDGEVRGIKVILVEP